MLSIPLGVPWKRRSLPYTSAEISAADSSAPRCPATARTSAVAIAAPLPMPLAIGMSDVMTTSKSGAHAGEQRATRAATSSENGSSGASASDQDRPRAGAWRRMPEPGGPGSTEARARTPESGSAIAGRP